MIFLALFTSLGLPSLAPNQLNRNKPVASFPTTASSSRSTHQHHQCRERQVNKNTSQPSLHYQVSWHAEQETKKREHLCEAELCLKGAVIMSRAPLNHSSKGRQHNVMGRRPSDITNHYSNTLVYIIYVCHIIMLWGWHRTVCWLWYA